jgi:hypothetical protein
VGKKKKQPKRWFKFVYDDGSETELEVSKCTVVHMEPQKVLFHFDRIGDGQHLLIANETMLPEGKKLDRIEVKREEDL